MFKEIIIKIYKKKNKKKLYNINEKIKSYKVKIIYNNNNKTEIILKKEALKLAKKSNLDLVEINPNNNPPICKILDYGKFIYKKKKNIKKQKKNKSIQIKEIKFRLNTNKNDYKIKIKNIYKFIKKKYKIKITIILRGREIIYKNIAINMLNKIKNKLKNLTNVDYLSKKYENKQIIMILNPKK